MPQPAQEFVDMREVLDEVIEEMLRANPKITKPAFTLASRLVDLFCDTSAPIGVVAIAMALILRYSLDYAEEQYDLAQKANVHSWRIH